MRPVALPSSQRLTLSKPKAYFGNGFEQRKPLTPNQQKLITATRAAIIVSSPPILADLAPKAFDKVLSGTPPNAAYMMPLIILGSVFAACTHTAIMAGLKKLKRDRPKAQKD